MARQTRITVETNSMLVLRGRSLMRAWCADCGSEQEMIALERAQDNAGAHNVSADEWLNRSSLHFLDRNGGRLVCLRSLLASVNIPKIR
jgi:hypothetical protein